MYNEELAIVQNDADLFGSLRSPESMQKARKNQSNAASV